MATRRNIRIRTNSSFVTRVRWKDDAGDPYILSDAKMQVRETINSETTLIDANVANGMIALDGVNGWATVTITPADMADITWFGAGVYDILLTRESDDLEIAMVEGNAIISRGVTRG